MQSLAIVKADAKIVQYLMDSVSDVEVSEEHVKRALTVFWNLTRTRLGILKEEAGLPAATKNPIRSGAALFRFIVMDVINKSAAGRTKEKVVAASGQVVCKLFQEQASWVSSWVDSKLHSQHIAFGSCKCEHAFTSVAPC